MLSIEDIYSCLQCGAACFAYSSSARCRSIGMPRNLSWLSLLMSMRRLTLRIALAVLSMSGTSFSRWPMTMAEKMSPVPGMRVGISS